MNAMGMHDDVPDEEITLRHMADLENSSDPGDQARATQLGEKFVVPAIEAARESVNNTMRGFQVKLPKTLSMDWAERSRADAERLERTMREVHQIQAERDQHKYDAEEAAIDTARLLDAMVELSHAQQSQLSTQAELLQAMVNETAALADLARASEEQDNTRWGKSWFAQRAELIIAGLAATLAGVAIWAAFAAAQAPVVNVPAPIVKVEVPTTTTTTAPTTTTAAGLGPTAN
jgi:hypothetical protein